MRIYIPEEFKNDIAETTIIGSYNSETGVYTSNTSDSNNRIIVYKLQNYRYDGYLTLSTEVHDASDPGVSLYVTAYNSGNEVITSFNAGRLGRLEFTDSRKFACTVDIRRLWNYENIEYITLDIRGQSSAEAYAVIGNMSAIFGKNIPHIA